MTLLGGRGGLPCAYPAESGHGQGHGSLKVVWVLLSQSDDETRRCRHHSLGEGNEEPHYQLKLSQQTHTHMLLQSEGLYSIED